MIGSLKSNSPEPFLFLEPVKGFGNPSKIELQIASGASKSGFKLHLVVCHRDEVPLLLLLPSVSCRLDVLEDFLTLQKLSVTGGASIKLIGTVLKLPFSDSAERLALLQAFDLIAKPFPTLLCCSLFSTQVLESVMKNQASDF